MASRITAMLSARSLRMYSALLPKLRQPKHSRDTSSPVEPSFVYSIHEGVRARNLTVATETRATPRSRLVIHGVLRVGNGRRWRDQNVDIARIDTAHGGCHIDRLYLPENHDRPHDDSVFAARPEGAVSYLPDENRWREWLDRYDANHGLPE